MSNVALQFTIPTGTQDGRHFLTPAAKSILVIDDSPTIRKIVEMALCREGYEVKSFNDGIDAMKWLATPGSRIPDLVVVDISLPKLDGYEVIRRFRANPRFANTTCIILSRHDGVEDKLKGKSAGANAYVTKPFTIQELLATIRTHIMGASVNGAF